VQKPIEQSPGSVRVIRATREQEPILANLLELYVHDFSEFYPVELGQDGRFGYKHLHDYWTEPNHHPFLITVGDKLAGFALVKKASALLGGASLAAEPVWDMAEFFIVRGHRRHGVGLTAAHQVWRMFPGRWQVRVMHSNPAALHFWQRAIDIFAGHSIDPLSIERGGNTWAVFIFESNAEASG
jgi:predicted acetyltransferase